MAVESLHTSKLTNVSPFLVGFPSNTKAVKMYFKNTNDTNINRARKIAFNLLVEKWGSKAK